MTQAPSRSSPGTGCVTGLAARVAGWVARIGRQRGALVLPAVMVLSALLSAVMSSTGTVAVMLPVVLGLGRALDRPVSGLLLPLAFAAQLGGVLTLIGTPPNLVVSQIELAGRLEIGAEPLLIGLAIAASTALATPVASPVNALVLGPGGYRFRDFLKAGVALQIVVLALAAAVILAVAPG